MEKPGAGATCWPQQFISKEEELNLILHLNQQWEQVQFRDTKDLEAFIVLHLSAHLPPHSKGRGLNMPYECDSRTMLAQDSTWHTRELTHMRGLHKQDGVPAAEGQEMSMQDMEKIN